MANTSLRVSELGFFEIKENMKTFLKSQSEFADYDFEGSTMSTLLDILAYNTYYNSFYTNMIANEMFLDTATQRETAVSRAKEFGYIPESAHSARAKIQVSFAPSDSPNEIVIPKYTKFKTTLDGVNYQFTTNQEVSIPRNSSGVFTTNLDIFEGQVLTYTYTYSKNGLQYFAIPNSGVDTDSLVVSVKSNSTTTDRTFYSQITDLTEVDSTSTIYFLQENLDGHYEVYFGDGVLGKGLSNGNVIEITARITSGSIPNGARSFTPTGYVGYNRTNPTSKYAPSLLTTKEAAMEGTDVEGVESIKFNAPKLYELQNRLVTDLDYKNYILSQYSDIQGISVWGGDQNDPPIYGKVMISIKPRDGYVISSSRRQVILDQLETRNVMSIEPLLIDPSFIYINPTIQVNYNPDLTSLSADAVFNKVASAIKNYEDNVLGNFERGFRFSKFINTIDNADASIVSNETSITLEKRFYPTLNSILTYKINFNTPLKHPYAGYLGTVSSTPFKIAGVSDWLHLDDDGQENLRLYSLSSTNSKIYYKSTGVGSVDYSTGTLIISAVVFTDFEGDEIRINVQSAQNDFTPIQNQIVLLSYPQVTMFSTTAGRSVKSSIVDVDGNLSPIRVDGILSSVVI